MRRTLPAVGLALLARAALAYEPELPPLAANGPLALRSVSPNATRVERFGLLELTVDLSATYGNPFDPRQIELNASFRAPDGATVEVPGFFYQTYCLESADPGAVSPLIEDGPPGWRVRFTPTQAGTWAYRLTARDVSGRVESPETPLEVIDSPEPGFIRVSRRNPRYFEFESGAPFIPVGQNLQNDWPQYDHSRRVAAAGANALRIWPFCHWTWLEWAPNRDFAWAGPGHYMRSYGGPGIYNQRIAWILDHHLAQWEQDGLHGMLCLGNSGELDHPDDYGYWGGHPYGATNGGPLQSGAEFWANEEARRLYRQRLRYIVARYGYSTHIWAWELWNELGRETDEIVAWHAEMAGYLRQIDPNRHLVTTSHWGMNAERNVRTWALPEIDFTQSHNYAGPETLLARTTRALAASAKPHVIGEGGIGDLEWNPEADPEGIDIHNALWAGLMSGAAGPTLPWGWRERIEPKGLFWNYTALARLLAELPLNAAPWEPLPPGSVTVSGAESEARYSPVLIVPIGPDWGARTPRSRFPVRPEGTVEGLEELSPVLYGSVRGDWANPPTLVLNCPTDTRLQVCVPAASHSVVRIDVDGQTALRDDRFNVPFRAFDAQLSVPLRAGAHEVTLHNDGADWARLGRILLQAYRDTQQAPDLQVCGLSNDVEAVLWLHHRLNEWAYEAAGVEAAPLAPAQLTLKGLPAGRYRLEWWDTYDGTVHPGPELSGTDAGLTIPVPSLTTDTACRVLPTD